MAITKAISSFDRITLPHAFSEVLGLLITALGNALLAQGINREENG